MDSSSLGSSTSLRQRFLARLDWQFIRRTSGIMFGITLARVLGFAFSFLLARTLETEDFGAVQYTITLATLVGILTVPFAEQVMPWFISHYRDDEIRLEAVLSSGAAILVASVLLSLVIAAVVLAAINRLSIAVVVIFLGITLFNTYAGLGRGFMASARLLIAYIGSNALQLIAVLVVVMILGRDSALPVMLIYGLSYILPIVILQLTQPLPIVISATGIRRPVIHELLRFAVPSWLSHALFTVTFALDILLIEHFQGEAAVGVYSLTKTLVMVFSFASQGVAMMLMPKIAASGEGSRRILFSALAITLGVNFAALIPYVLIYPWFVPTLVGDEYFIGATFGLLMATSAIVYSIHAIVTSYILGRKQPGLETASRICILIVMVVSGSLLIPSQGAVGAAWAALLSASAGVVSYPLILLVRPRLHRRSAPDL